MTYIDLLAMLELEDAHPGGFHLTKQLLSVLPISPQTKVLEVGCGLGKTAGYIWKMYGCSVTAVDVNERMLEKAKRRFQKERLPIFLYRASAEKLYFPDETFDLLLSESVTTFTKVEKSLAEYRRVLKDRGLFAAIEMTAEKGLSWREREDIEKLYGISEVYTEKEWVELFWRRGFRNIRCLGGSSLKEMLAMPVSPLQMEKLPSKMAEIFSQHLQLMYAYQKVLGYRVFLCEK